MLQEHDGMNAEGYCRVCRQPLGISGLCYTCMLNDDIKNGTFNRYEIRKEALDKLIVTLKNSKDSDA